MAILLVLNKEPNVNSLHQVLKTKLKYRQSLSWKLQEH